MLAYLEQVLNALIYELYLPGEVHGAGLQFFDLVERLGIPDIDAIPESERRPRLRAEFEKLYDANHPLRVALSKLQTLEVVGIIEGTPLASKRG